MARKHEWRSFDSYNKARVWVNEKYADSTRGKTFSRSTQRKLLSMYWKQAKAKDKRGEF